MSAVEAPEDDGVSEIGDGEDSVISAAIDVTASSGTATVSTGVGPTKPVIPGKVTSAKKKTPSRPPGGKAKLKKSKLGQEITAADATSTTAIEDLI